MNTVSLYNVPNGRAHGAGKNYASIDLHKVRYFMNFWYEECEIFEQTKKNFKKIKQKALIFLEKLY